MTKKRNILKALLYLYIGSILVAAGIVGSDLRSPASASIHSR